MSAQGNRWIVVGLGNPGPEYERTRHNIGALVAAHLATKHGLRFSTHKSRANVAEFKNASGTSIAVATLRCYMNESGGPIKSLVDYYKISREQLIVLHDELDIPFQTLRIKLGGGDNGHNGLKSITAVLGADYYRIRLGIGRPIGQQDPADFVLKPFNSTERTQLADFVATGAAAVESLIEAGLEATQREFNN